MSLVISLRIALALIGKGGKVGLDTAYSDAMGKNIIASRGSEALCQRRSIGMGKFSFMKLYASIESIGIGSFLFAEHFYAVASLLALRANIVTVPVHLDK